jgi:hypothetical protein
MILQDILTTLSGLKPTSIEVTNAISETIRITELYNTHKIDISEFNELISDIQLDALITNSAKELQDKEELRVYIDAAIYTANLAITAI